MRISELLESKTKITIQDLLSSYRDICDTYSSATSYLYDYYYYADGVGKERYLNHDKPEKMSDGKWADILLREHEKLVKEGNKLLSKFKKHVVSNIDNIKNSNELHKGKSAAYLLANMPNLQLVPSLDQEDSYGEWEFISQWPNKGIELNGSLYDQDEEDGENDWSSSGGINVNNVSDFYMFPGIMKQIQNSHTPTNQDFDNNQTANKALSDDPDVEIQTAVDTIRASGITQYISTLDNILLRSYNQLQDKKAKGRLTAYENKILDNIRAGIIRLVKKVTSKR